MPGDNEVLLQNQLNVTNDSIKKRQISNRQRYRIRRRDRLGLSNGYPALERVGSIGF